FSLPLKMEEIKSTLQKFDESLKTLLDQVIGVKEDIKKVGTRVATLEQEHEKRNPTATQPVPLVRPRTEYELKKTSTLPDCVKELPTFEGEPEKFVSWVNRAQAIVNDYEIIIGKPLYRTIILYIRQKIRGDADLALSSYNVEDDNWLEIKRVLSLHYADKRDIPLLARYSSIAPNHSNVHALIDGDHDDDTKQALDNLLKEFASIFEPLSSGEAVNTTVKAEIRTSTQDPIFTRSYPYPTNMRGEVE
ncbi:hypothetical protein KR067_012629, partial [Drosophila pandora]